MCSLLSLRIVVNHLSPGTDTLVETTQGGAVAQSQAHTRRPEPGTHHRSPWRWGLLLTLRDRLDRGTYSVSSDAIAASIIDRTDRQPGEEPRR